MPDGDRMTGVGLLGCGAMGGEVAAAVRDSKSGDARLMALFDQAPGAASALAESLGVEVQATDSIEAFLANPDIELVVESASPNAVRAHAEAVLSAGKDLLLMSSGALTDPELFVRVTTLAVEGNRRVIVPSGALGGIDAIRAVSDRLDEVTLTTTKPPRALRGAPGFQKWESKNLTESTVIFEGVALDAVRLFPANVNVAATLSIAGIGPARTTVKVIADPQSEVNRHEITASGDFGKFRFEMDLHPHDRNPKTSFLAVVSAIEALRSACSSGIRIGT
jgi:aspartate dehydrogenase